MTDFETRVGGEPVAPPEGWRFEWVDRGDGVARLTDGERVVACPCRKDRGVTGR